MSEHTSPHVMSESQTPAEDLLVEPVLCSCTVVTSQPDTVDMTVTFLSSRKRLESDPRENDSHPCAQRTLHPFCVVSHACSSRDACQDRQPEIQSSLVREDFQRIMVQTNNDCRFRTLILTNSPRQQRSLVGR